MSTITLPASDPRGAKAVAIATEAGQWLRCRTRDGRKAYGIRSSRNADEVYFVTRTSCTCYDGQRRTCKHQLAVQLHCALVAEQEKAKQHPEDVFSRFEQDDRPLPTPELSRILGGPAPYVTNHVDEDDEDDVAPLCGPLCGAKASGNRVCAAPHYHTGAHVFVVLTERED